MELMTNANTNIRMYVCIQIYITIEKSEFTKHKIHESNVVWK